MDAYCKIEGIPGECQDHNHKNWIEVIAIKHSLQQETAAQRSTAGGAAVGRCVHGYFTIVKEMDKATPKLNFLCSSGNHAKTIEIHLCEAGGQQNVYMTYKLGNVAIARVETVEREDLTGSRPREEIQFNYDTIQWIYTEIDHSTGRKKGNTENKWSTRDNKGA